MITKVEDYIPEDQKELEKLFEEDSVPENLKHFIVKWEEKIRRKVLAKSDEPIVTPFRWKLQDERVSHTHRFNIRGSDQSLKGYLTIGMYNSGRVGEMFLEISKEGSFASGVMDGLMTAISIGLQHGVPLRSYVTKFIHTRFEPSGIVRSAPKGMFGEAMKSTNSVLDYIARYLDFRFPEGHLKLKDGRII